MVPESLTHVTDAPVHFGKYAILGCGCTVLPGVRIGEGTAAGAMSLLNADTEPWSVYGGVPARFIHARKRDILQLAQTLEH
jgi:acetyltransferase-like isoleucine patch superfamily enzyme